MEDPWGNWISQLEMDGDNYFDQSNESCFDEQKFLREMLQEEEEEPDLSPESVKSGPCPNRFLAEAFVEGGAHSRTNSLLLDETSFKGQHHHDNGTLDRISCSSRSIISNLHKPLPAAATCSPNIPTTCILPFDNNNSSSPSGVVGPCTRHALKRTTENIEEEKEQRARKKVGRNSPESKNHIMAERKRRQEVTETIIALAATIPGLKKMDKAHVLREAVNYVKQLQERVRDLENENKEKKAGSLILTLKSQASSDRSNGNSETNSSSGYRCNDSLLEIEARVQEKEVLILILCEKQKDIVLKILILLKRIHLSAAKTSVLPFGTSSLIINIIAQMDDDYTMTMDDLVNNLRQDMLESRDMQQLLEY